MPKERRLEYIRFVKPNPDTTFITGFTKASTSKDTACSISDGKDVKKFYCNLLTDGSSTELSKSHIAKTNVVLSNEQPETQETKAKTIDKQNLHRYFRAIEDGNIKDIEEYLNGGVDVDAVDDHGWTALMCASCSGRLNIVKFLFQKNCNAKAVNKKGQTALEIAIQAKKVKVVKFMQGEVTHEKEFEKTKVKHEDFYCNVCKREVKGSSEKSHTTSTVHLFNAKIIPKEQDYVLPETNAGFQMMLRSGWDQDKGLGSSGQGRKHPVKTLLKRDRLGLGSKAKASAKVTHFGPKDKAAIKAPGGTRCMKNSTLSKRKQSKLQQKEKEKERNFRRDFY